MGSDAHGVKRHLSKAETRGGIAGQRQRPRNESMESTRSGSKGSIQEIDMPGIHPSRWAVANMQNQINKSGSESSMDSMAPRRMVDEDGDEHLDSEQEGAILVYPGQEVAAVKPSLGAEAGAQGGALVQRYEPTSPVPAVPSNGDSVLDPELLIMLQTKIAGCFQRSYEVFKDDEVVSPGIVSSAVASRELLNASENILKKLEQTGHTVMDLISDMTLGVEEGEIEMALTAFGTIKEWIKTIQGESQELLKANVKVIAAVNSTLQLARRRQRVREATRAGFRVSDALALEGGTLPSQVSISTAGTGTSAGAVEAAQAGEMESTNLLKEQELNDVMLESLRLGAQGEDSSAENQKLLAAKRRESATHSAATADKVSHAAQRARPQLAHGQAAQPLPQHQQQLVVINNETGVFDEANLSPINDALAMLQQIDRLLQKAATFWSHMEVLVNVLMQKANHAESLVNWTRNPKLRDRFLERIDEYSNMWMRVTQMSQLFSQKQRQIGDQAMYKFLTEG